MFPWTDYMFVLSTTLLDSIGNILQLVFLSLLLPELMKSAHEELAWTYIYAGGICLSSFVRVLARNHLSYYAYLMALRWKSATIGIIYKKVIGLSQADISRITSGYIINLIASDLQRFEHSVNCICGLIQALLETSSVAVLMVYLFGWRPLLGVAFMILLSLYYGGMAKVCAILRSRISKVADQRVNIMNSIIPGIRTVKMYAWEWPFFQRVKRLRSLELKLTRWKTAILATFQSLLYTSSSIAAFISLVALVLSGTELTSYNTFMILSLATVLKYCASWKLFFAGNNLADFATALARIQSILEFQKNNIHRDLFDAFANKGWISSRTHTSVHFGKDPCISLQNIFCCWHGDWNKPTLKSLSLSVSKGDLLFITGPVGCGKSSLLYAILHEISLLKGKVSCQGKVSWVGQQPWVFSGTIQENILFGEPFDPQRYHKILQACDLQTDLQRFPDADMTLVGERGIVLSGGQRTRVGLARALYSDAEIYLFDDPFSALDTKVGDHIFKSCLMGLLGDKTRLVTTHNLKILRDAENIVLMKEGSSLEKVDFKALVKSGFQLAAMDNAKIDGRVTSAERPTAQEESAMILDTKYARLETAEEDRLIGSVPWKLYLDYIRAGIRTASAVALVIFFLIVQGLSIFADWWLLQLTSGPHDRKHHTVDLYIYGGMVGGAFLLHIARAVVLVNALLNSSQHLHNSMMLTVLKAPVLFFDTNPVGRIINRFSRDIGIMDELMPDVFLEAVEIVLFCIGAVLLPSVLNPWIILPAIPLMVLFMWYGRYYLRTSRDLRRLEGVSRSPVLSHFSDTLEGLVTIRSYKKENAFLEELYRFGLAFYQLNIVVNL
ncbi:ATP-binding cassette sub-family C member 4-like [Oculina patagonica]